MRDTSEYAKTTKRRSVLEEYGETTRQEDSGTSVEQTPTRHTEDRIVLDFSADDDETAIVDKAASRTSEHIVVDLRPAGLIETRDSGAQLEIVRDRPGVSPPESPHTEVDARPQVRDHPSVVDTKGAASQLAPEPSWRPLSGGLVAATPTKLAVKRTIDIVVAAIVIVLVSPIVLFTLVLVKATSHGPVLYRSTRVGRGGSEFTFLKIRTMYRTMAHESVHLQLENEQTGPVFKMRRDPRVTPVGHFLRKGSIDELPQLLHVLSGKMSLVGPRPAIPGEVAQYDARTRQRLAVKPGITCIWQVSGRSDIDFDTWMDMDLEYIDSWSLLSDVRILAKTIPAVLSGSGAY